MSISFTLLAINGYLLTVFLVYRHVTEAPGASRLSTISSIVWVITLLIHGLSLGDSLLTPHGLDLSLYHALSLVAWMVAALLFATTVRQPLESLSLPLLPLVTLALTAGLTTPALHAQIISGEQGLQWHILGSLLAFSMFSLAATQAIILAYQDHQIRNHKLKGWVQHLPPLQHMESFLFQLIGMGFVLLSASLVTGWFFIDDFFEQQLVHKTTLSLIAWVLFAVLLAGRWISGWRGHVVVNWTIGGFTLLILAYFGSKLVLEIILKPIA